MIDVEALIVMHLSFFYMYLKTKQNKIPNFLPIQLNERKKQINKQTEKNKQTKKQTNKQTKKQDS